MEKFKVYKQNGKRVIERLVFPRFKGYINPNNNIEVFEIIDVGVSTKQMDKSLKAASEFISKGHLIK